MENNKLKIEKYWSPLFGNNITVDEGLHVVTLENDLGARCITLAEYKDGEWCVDDRNIPLFKYKVAAVLNERLDNFLECYNGAINKFKRGDVIVWDDEWMVIASFDYPSDIAARAEVGKHLNDVYENFSPGNLREAKLADENQLEEIKKQLVEYYRTRTNAKGKDISKEYLELCGLKNVNNELYNYVKEKLEEKSVW